MVCLLKGAGRSIAENQREVNSQQSTPQLAKKHLH
jgi:hypothetical protein